MPPPGSGVLTAFILNILDGHLMGQKTGKASRDPKIYHRIAEAFKHAYAQRTKLADPRFVLEVSEVRRVKEKMQEIFQPINKIALLFCLPTNYGWLQC